MLLAVYVLQKNIPPQRVRHHFFPREGLDGKTATVMSRKEMVVCAIIGSNYSTNHEWVLVGQIDDLRSWTKHLFVIALICFNEPFYSYICQPPRL